MFNGLISKSNSFPMIIFAIATLVVLVFGEQMLKESRV
jgi:hypothetical protein